jgi:hypothetical protein
MSRSLAVCAFLLAGPLCAATYFATARDVECMGGQVRLAKAWTPLLQQSFDVLPEGWELKNYESNLEINTTDQAHGGAGALWLSYAKERDTAWELIAPPCA